MPLKRWTDFKAGDRVIASDCQCDAGTVLEVGPDATVAGRVFVKWDDGTPASWLRADLLKPAAPDFSALPDIDAGRMPVVRITAENEAMADSRDVADYFGKEHRRVLQSIRELHCTDDFRRHNFVPFKIKDLTGESTSHVEMTKDGFTFLVMGFTGGRASIWKERYIAAFNVMEAELRKRLAAPVAPALPGSYAAALRELAAAVETVEQQQAVISTMAPKAEFVDRFVNAEGLYGCREAGKALGCMPQKFCDWLRDEKYCFPKGDIEPYAEYLGKEIFAARNYTARNGHAGVQYFITPKGLAYFATRVPDRIKPPKQTSVPALPAAATAH